STRLGARRRSLPLCPRARRSSWGSAALPRGGHRSDESRCPNLEKALAAEPLRHGHTQPNKRLFRETEPPPAPMEHSPAALELAPPQRQRYQRFVLQF